MKAVIPARKKRYYMQSRALSVLAPIEKAFPRSRLIGRVLDKLAFVRSAYGPYLYNTPGDLTFEFCVNGYGPFIADIIDSRQHPFVFLDIGANLGVFSLVAAGNPLCVGGIAFEPIPSIFQNLRKNIQRNGAEKIMPVEGAVSDCAEDHIWLSFNPSHSGISRISDGPANAVQARVISPGHLDALLGDSRSAVVAKIDVEGAEPSVLACLRNTSFYQRIDDVIIEISEINLGAAGKAQLLAMLAEDGYSELSRSGGERHYDAWYRRSESGT